MEEKENIRKEEKMSDAPCIYTMCLCKYITVVNDESINKAMLILKEQCVVSVQY